MRKILTIALLAAVGALAIPALASANVPSYQDRVDAKKFAGTYWDSRRERDRLSIECASLELKFEPIHVPGILGFVTDHYSPNCVIHMNSRQSWNWSKLCTTVIHEYGHLLGVEHSSKPNSIMYPTYPNSVWGNRFPACEYEEN